MPHGTPDPESSSGPRRACRTVSSALTSARSCWSVSPRHRRPEKRIGGALLTHGGRRAVAGIEDRVIGQRQQLALDARDERGEVAAGQIGPSNRPRKHHVTAEDHPRRDEAYVTGG